MTLKFYEIVLFFAISASFFHIQTVTSNDCDLTYNSSCYEVFEMSNPINWLDAQSSCAIWGGDLTSITTERENNYLNTLITSSVGNCWIGLNDRDVEGMYTWIDGTTVSYTNWTSTPSDDTNSNCVQINNAGNGIWESVSCDMTLNAFLCKRDSSITTTIDGRFGKLTDGGLGFTGLNPKTFIFDSLTLVCGSSGGTISWLYSQNNTKIGFGESTTYDNAELGLSWLVIKISKQGYYGCKAYNFFKEIGVFDPSLTTVAAPGSTYTYIVGIDREDMQLLCDPVGSEYELFNINWFDTAEKSYYNPINIYSLQGFSSELSCKSDGNELLSIYISVQVPLMTITDSSGFTGNFSILFPDFNEFIVQSSGSDITLSINIDGKWNIPDNSNSTNSTLTIPNFTQQNNGVYKFYINNWDGVEVCAIQVLLGFLVVISNFDDTSQQVNYTVGSLISTLYYSNPDIQISDIRWTTDMVSNGDTNLYSVEYPNPVNLSEVFANVGAGLHKFSCFYRKSPVTLLGSLQLAIKDTVAISIRYEDYNMSFSDANNPMFPSPQEIRILEGTKDIRFTCGLDYCFWNISHQIGLIASDTAYTIPELTSAFNGNISLKRFTSTGKLYTTAQISIYAIQHETESNNTTVFISIIVLLIIVIVITTFITIPVCILLCMKRQKSTGDCRPKNSKEGGEAFPGYVNLTAANRSDYMTISEISLVATDTQEKTKPKSMLAPSQSYINITPTQKREYVNMEQENTEDYTVMTPQEENCTKLSPKFISTENFPVVYQQYVDSGIGRDSLFSIEFQKLNEHSNHVCILEQNDALKLENGQKNPNKNILPFDENRIVLDSPHFDCDYINASYMHASCYQFIATINPTKETHRDFLQMIYQTEASLVIMLITRNEKPKIFGGVSNRVCYWPKKNEPINCEPFVTTLINSTETNAFVKQDISLKEISTGKEHSFTQCISPIWNEDSTVAEMALGVALLSKIIKHKQDSNNAPVVIHCEDGISKTGIILTVLNAIKDINVRKSVNIFSTVRFLRVQRVSMIPTLACYTTCYSLLNEYCSIHL